MLMLFLLLALSPGKSGASNLPQPTLAPAVVLNNAISNREKESAFAMEPTLVPAQIVRGEMVFAGPGSDGEGTLPSIPPTSSDETLGKDLSSKTPLTQLAPAKLVPTKTAKHKRQATKLKRGPTKAKL